MKIIMKTTASRSYWQIAGLTGAILTVGALSGERLATHLAAQAGTPSSATGAAGNPCASPANKIVAENCKPGNPSTDWDINGNGDESIQGFATDISYNVGETARFKIKTDSAR